MSYGGSASSVISKKNDLSFVVINVNNLGFDNVWKSNASQKLLTSLKGVLNKINNENDNLQAFADALKKIGECIEIDGRIADLSARLASIDTDTEEGADDAASIRAEISRLKSKKEQIKNQIKGIISGFGSVGAEFSMSFSGISAASWNELVELFDEYSKLTSRGNVMKALTLYDENGNVIRDGQEYFDQRINAIKDKYTGVERNYYVSLEIIKLSIEAGIKIPYKHNGTTAADRLRIDTRYAVPASAVANGLDCNAFASYVIFDENSTEKWLSVGQYENAGIEVPLNQAQAGDIFANGGHVGIILDYNSETGEYAILHSTGGEDSGMVCFQIEDKNYFISNGHTIRRMDSNYVSPELAKILDIDTSNYSPSGSSANVSTANYVVSTSDVNVNSSNSSISLSTDSYDYIPDVSVGSLNMNGDMYNGQPLTAPQGINRNGPTASETWYDLPMSGVVKNMEKLYGYTDLEASIRDDGVKVLSGVDANGQRFENLVMVAADVEHMSNPDGTFERGEIVETSLGTGIVVDACGRSISERKSTGNVHFDIATAWGTGEYKKAAYADYNK